MVQGLEDAGITGFVLNHPGLPGTPDLVLADAKLAVFVNGCFWHRCPYCLPHFPESNKQYWEAKFARNKIRDIRVRKELRLLGWKPIVIWECHLKKKPQRVLFRIKRAIEESNG